MNPQIPIPSSSCDGRRIGSTHANVPLYERIVKDLSGRRFMGRNITGGGERAAAEYIMEQFRSLCRAGYTEGPLLQPFVIPENLTRGEVSFAVDGKPLAAHRDFVVKEFTGPADASLPVIYALDPDIYVPERFVAAVNALAAEQAFVVLDYDRFCSLPLLEHRQVPFLETTQERFLDYLPGLKVGGIIFRYSKIPLYFKARSYFTLPYPVLCVHAGFPPDARRAAVRIGTEFVQEHESNNIIAWVKGTSESGEVYAFVAHYDHLGCMGRDNVCPGANDNASGVAALLALAAHYACPQNRPSHSMMFLWTGAEEENLLGSIHYVRHPLYPLEKIRFLFNLDMIGDTPELLRYEASDHAAAGVELLRKINAEHGYFPHTLHAELTDNSDHYYFVKAGVPAVYFETRGAYYRYYHTPWDTFEHTTPQSFVRLFEMIREFIDQYQI